MPDSQSVIVLRAYREAMNAAEEEIVRQMGERWLALERTLEGNIAALANEMQLKAQAGEVVTDAMIRRSERYAILKAQMEAEIAKYNREAAQMIAAGQENALKLGIQAATDAIDVMYPNALSSSFNRINVAAVEAMIGKAGDGSPLLELLTKDFGEAADAIVQALVDGVAQGLGAVKTAHGMVEGMGVGMDRALLIARTEVNGAYRAGSVEGYRQSGVVEGFMRLVARDEACLACLALDGEKFDTADEMDDHPNGRCTCVPILAGMDEPQWEKAQDWFADQSDARQREIMGDKRYEMYKNGMPIEDFGIKTHDPIWGASPQITPLSQLEQ
jgi:hypothetical protein